MADWPMAERWRRKADKNWAVWGAQDIETLLLATQEELGELTREVLEYRYEDGDGEEVLEELDDLAALMWQIRWALTREGLDV